MNFNHLKEAEMFLSGIENNDFDFIPLVSDEINDELSTDEPLTDVPVLPLKNTVLFPGVIFPITIGRRKSIELVTDAYENKTLIATVAQKDGKVENPTYDDLYKKGTLAQIVKILQMPDNTTTIVIQGKSKFELLEEIATEPYLRAKINILAEDVPDKKDKEFDAIISSLKDTAIKIVQLSSNIPQEAVFAIKNIENPQFLVNFVSSNSDLNIKVKQQLLETTNIKDRSMLLLEMLLKEVNKLELKGDIQQKVHNELTQQQKEIFLNQQLKTIQNELGVDNTNKEVEELKELAKGKKWNKHVKDVFEKELSKLERLHPSSPDFSNQVNYLQTIVELPWEVYTEDNFDLRRAEKILNKDHFGLDQVKDRILEHLAVLKLKGDLKSPIICLVGPPGVGKTSLGKSIADALNRKYIRMSLGGLHDEAEIRGHRKTYIGAMPGRIIQNLKKAQSSNPVFVLDEIDKMGSDFKGDPSFALLEVLDPEQNDTFYDNYLEVEYDLSKVMFVATANALAPLKPALRDRMEIINVSGYIVEEKIEIAKRHLLPQQLNNHGVKKEQLKFSKKIIEKLIDDYTRESGVRQLDKVVAKVIRYYAKKIGFNEEYNINISTNDLLTILGPPDFQKGKYEGNDFVGVVTGLAWTSVGGEILFVETSLSKGNGKLTLTGNLGSVMKESAYIALEYLKANAPLLKINEKAFETWNIHIHVPEGSIPKDGPSAGITMVTSLASAFTQRKIKKHLAMTGEITLRGKVLPVGGIKEKILAAKRADIKEIIISSENKKDISKIKDIYLKGLNFIYVDTIMDVLEASLLKHKINNPKEV